MEFRGIKFIDLSTIEIDDIYALFRPLSRYPVQEIYVFPSRKMKFFAVLYPLPDSRDIDEIKEIDGLFLADLAIVDSLGSIHNVETKICWLSEY